MWHLSLSNWIHLDKTFIRYNSSTLHDIFPAPPSIVTRLNNVMWERSQKDTANLHETKSCKFECTNFGDSRYREHLEACLFLFLFLGHKLKSTLRLVISIYKEIFSWIVGMIPLELIPLIAPSWGSWVNSGTDSLYYMYLPNSPSKLIYHVHKVDGHCPSMKIVQLQLGKQHI